jgi:hypothetical protein
MVQIIHTHVCKCKNEICEIVPGIRGGEMGVRSIKGEIPV